MTTYITNSLNELKTKINSLSEIVINDEYTTTIINNYINEINEYILTCDLILLINNDEMLNFIDILTSLNINPTQLILETYYLNIRNDNNNINNVNNINEVPIDDVVKEFILSNIIVKYDNFINNLEYDPIIINNDSMNFNNDIIEIIESNVDCELLDNELLYYNLEFEYVNINNPEL